MGRDLSVEFFESIVREDYDDEHYITYYYDENNVVQQPVEHEHFKDRNVDLGVYNYGRFKGTKNELISVITGLLTDENDTDYHNFEMIGHLSLIVHEMGEFYDYVIITNA